MKRFFLVTGLLVILVVAMIVVNYSPKKVYESKKTVESIPVAVPVPVPVPEKKIGVVPETQKKLSHEQCLKLAYDLQAFVMRLRIAPNSIEKKDCKNLLKLLALTTSKNRTKKCEETIKLHQKEVLIACR